MKTLAPATVNGAVYPALDPNNYLETHWNGTNHVYVEQSDLISSPLTAGISALPIPPIVELLNSSIAISLKFFGVFSDQVSIPYNTAFVRIQNVGTWISIEKSQGQYDAVALAKLDEYITDAKAKGQDVIYTFNGCPKWASGGTTNLSPPTDFAYVTNFMNFILARYGADIDYFEGWNEPNVGYTGTASQVVLFQKAIWDAVVAAGYGNKVISPSFTFRTGLGTLDTPATVNLDAFLTAGGGAYSHIIGYHPYTQRNLLAFDRSILPALNACLAAHSITQDVWVTEVGDSSPSLRKWKQAALLTVAQGAKRLLWFSYDNSTGGAHGYMNNDSVIAPGEWNAFVALLAGKTLTQLNSRQPSSSNNMCNYADLGAVVSGVPIVA